MVNTFIDCGDHPRRCGENTKTKSQVSLSIGSPPQVRGKRHKVWDAYEFDGITPAGAGKTRQPTPPNLNITDHPRRCGENFYLQPLMPGIMGSPPQVRGKQRGGLPENLKPRITPAGAGKTLRLSTCYAKYKDHPRRCGENKVNQKKSIITLGSPPQVRGKRAIVRTGDYSYGITPAGAGKTRVSAPPASCVRDHPRRCGENPDGIR